MEPCFHYAATQWGTLWVCDGSQGWNVRAREETVLSGEKRWEIHGRSFTSRYF